MARTLWIGAAVVCLVGTSSLGGETSAKTYTNPIIDEIGPADPSVILYDGRYYLYCTGDNRSYHVYYSTDLVHWTKGPKVFKPGEKNVWAPDVFHDPQDRRFYLYYTVNRRIGVAVADRPDATFGDRGTLFKNAIDAHMFYDGEGRYFLYYVQLPGFRIHVQPMQTPLEKKGKPTEIIRPTEPWETKRGAVTEGPWMLKHRDTYYLLYSGTAASSLDYAIGYATAATPTGPFVKYSGNPIVKRGNGALGPGHGCVVRDGADRLWSVYHQQKDDSQAWNRFICIDPLWFDQKGVLHGKATRGTPQTAPAVPSNQNGGAGSRTNRSESSHPMPSMRRHPSAPLLLPVSSASAQSLLPPDWNPKQAADRVLSGLITVTAPQVKGAHDAEMVITGGRAYIVAEVNGERPGEAASWPCVYSAMSIVNLSTMTVEKIIPFARSEQAFENETLSVGACFVPRIIRKDDKTLRCYFASEQPGVRQSQVWFIDFDLDRVAFENTIHRAKLKTSAGTFDMQPRHFHADAVAHGFRRPPKDYGLYLFDSRKVFDGKTYVAINNWAGKQNALAVANEAIDTFEVIGHYNEPQNFLLSESSVNRLPDGTWMAICRQDGGNHNYTFTTSRDGKTWTPNAHRDFVPNGTNSKPTFNRFHGTCYLGWQDAARVKDVFRSVFNIDVSRDGKAWERKYRFETEKSFQYPTFREYKGTVYLAVTQGDYSGSRKERIMFGRLEPLAAAAQSNRSGANGEGK